MSEVSSTESNPPTDTELSCPRCGCPLALDRLRQPPETFEVQRCPTCRGMFIETSKLRALESTFEVRLIEIRRIPDPQTQQWRLRCPACPDRLLEKHEHPRDRKVIVDHCPSCDGWWLDGGELEAIQEESLPVFVLGMALYLRDLVRGV